MSCDTYNHHPNHISHEGFTFMQDDRSQPDDKPVHSHPEPINLALIQPTGKAVGILAGIPPLLSSARCSLTPPPLTSKAAARGGVLVAGDPWTVL
ncbi:hypothetical protein BaRGS_00017933 [Batillaria attramentaria]|uniref:Uncharacterized protein n=1 Tax=Batillaria attramentaria TaxID=370345 RepID=A0ABD0KUK8_9CAEN